MQHLHTRRNERYFIHSTINASLGATYRIRVNATPLLNRTSPLWKTNITPVKHWYWNNTTPAQIQPHPDHKPTHFGIFLIIKWMPYLKGSFLKFCNVYWSHKPKMDSAGGCKEMPKLGLWSRWGCIRAWVVLFQYQFLTGVVLVFQRGEVLFKSGVAIMRIG